MKSADDRKVCGATLTILNHIQGLAVKNQLLGLACAFLCLLEIYELNHADVLGIAHQIVYCNDNPDTVMKFKGVKHFMKNEWNLG